MKDHYLQTLGWDANRVEQNIIHKYQESEISNFTVVDMESIMLYVSRKLDLSHSSVDVLQIPLRC